MEIFWNSKRAAIAIVIFCGVGVSFSLLPSGSAQASDDTQASADVVPETRNGIPITQVIESVSRQTKKRFILDPRLKGAVSIEGFDKRAISYRDLQAILEVYGFATVESGEVVRIIPDANIRQSPSPVINQDTQGVGDYEVVTRILGVGKLTALQLVPILRPLLPQYAHLAAYPPTNTLIVTARYSSVKTIEAVVNELMKYPVVWKPPPEAKDDE